MWAPEPPAGRPQSADIRSQCDTQSACGLGATMYNKKQLTRARIDAEEVAAASLTTWYSEQSAAIHAMDLSDGERDSAKRALQLEMGKRSRAAVSKAKRNTSLPK